MSLLYQPGTTWSYSDGGANWLADVLTAIFGTDLNSVMFDRVFPKLGIRTTDLVWRKNAYRGDTINGIKRREFGSGISASVDAMARVGYLYLRRGFWDGTRILPESFIDQVRQPVASADGLPESKFSIGDRPRFLRSLELALVLNVATRPAKPTGCGWAITTLSSMLPVRLISCTWLYLAGTPSTPGNSPRLCSSVG